MKEPKKNISRLFLIISIISVNFVILIVLKYYQNGLTIREFSWDYLGNLFNLLTSLLIILGFAVYFARYKVFENGVYSLSLILSITAVIPLVLIYLLDKDFFVLRSTIIFNYPLKKVMIGVLFVLHQLILFFLLVEIWTLFLDHGKILILKPVVGVLLTIGILSVFSFGYTLLDKRENVLNKQYDFGIVFGAAVWSKDKPSPILEGRILKAQELLEKGIIKRIFLTGGNAPGELSEAKTAYLFLKDRGVDTTKMYLERETRTTLDQVKYIKFDLIPGFKTNSILLISDKFHLSRVLDMCKFFNISSDAVSSDHQIRERSMINYRMKESIGLLFFWFFAV